MRRDRSNEPLLPPDADAEESPALGAPELLTTFVGRLSDIERAATLLAEGSRLLTLTGPGGVGKTRLALEIARRTASLSSGGARFVPLASQHDPARVPELIRSAVAPRAHRPLSKRPPDLPQLLVVDNFEHVAAAAPFVARLLESRPTLRVLATSREALHVRGERELRVGPLPLADAIALFVERARAVSHEFELTEQNEAAVAEICTRLDGLPLAVELAAARVRLLSPHAILARLERPLDLLTNGHRDLPARQRTLRHTIAWSYELLSPLEQRLFARIAAFAGYSRLELMEQVGALGEAAPARCVLEGIASLVRRNLLRRVHDASGEVRLAMLDTVRAFALERLAETGEELEIRAAHAALCTQLAEAASARYGTPDEQEWFDLVERDLKNIRAALRWSIDADEAGTALRIAQALQPFWRTRGRTSEGACWLGAARARVDGATFPPDGLTAREAEVLRLLASGLSNERIGERLVVSVRTVHAHVRSIYRKLGIGSRVEATRYALERALV